MNRFFKLLIILLGVSLLVAACGGPAAPEAQAPAEAPAEEQAEAPAEEPAEEAAEEPAEEPTEEPAEAQAEAPAEAEEEASAEEGKVLKIRLPGEPQNGDPAFWIGSEEPIMLSVYEGLVSYKPGTWEVVNTLAESITPSEDGLSVEFKLKEGIQFHGGYGEVTAEDVKFSFERIAGLTEPALDSPYKGDWVSLDHVEVTDMYSGKIVLKEPFAALWTTTLPQSSGFILSKKAVEELGEEYPSKIIGTGPYELVEWVTNERYLLKRFEDYGGNNLDYAEPVEWDEILFLPISEHAAAEIALETGEVDFGEIIGESIDQFEANDEFVVHKRDTIDYRWVGMNVQHPNLADVNVRRAIRAAVDVPSIIEAVYDNKYSRTCSMIAPGQIGHWAEAPCYERDLEQAQAFLEEAGNPQLDLIMRFGPSEDDKAIGEIVQANLAEIGINVELEALDDAAMTDAHFGETGLKEAQLFVVGFITNPDPSWSTVWFLCEQVEVWNWMQWCSEEYDRLHYEALKELDPDKRAEMYLQMEKLWDEAAHSIWTVTPTLYWAARPDLEPSLMPHGRILAWNFRSK
jgi:peptide/nickel transport system substrate-binding protein